MHNMVCRVIDDISNDYGKEFFHKIGLSFSALTNVEQLIIATIDETQLYATTVVVICDQVPQENYTFSLKNTPHIELLNGPTYYPDDVGKNFPLDAQIHQLKMTSYLGIPLGDNQGNCIGLLIAMYRKPINNHEQIFELFTALSGRISAEIMNTNQHAKEKNRVIELTKELADINVELASFKGQLLESEKMASLGSLVAGITHEVNTPLGIAITTHSILAGECKKLALHIKNQDLTLSAMNHYIEASESALLMQGDNLDRAKKLIENFKKSAADQHRLELETINLKDYYQKVSSTLRSLLKPHKVTLAIVCDDLLTVKTYPGIHAQIITNLISNSVRHGFSNQKPNTTNDNNITITISTKGPSEIEVHYQDNGEGLSDSAAEHVFEAYFTTARDKGGIGLGMAIISKLIIEKLNGTITVDNQGQGAHFIYSFTNERELD